MTLLHLLLIEDCADDADLICLELERAGFEIDAMRVDTAPAAKQAMRRGGWDLVISDFSIPSLDGLQAFKLCREEGVQAPFIVVSGTIGEDVAVDAMRAGVDDYVLKGQLGRLGPAVARELRAFDERRRAKLERERFEAHLRMAQRMDTIGRLASGLAHDFNNLLMVIATESDDMLAGLAAENEHRENVELIREAVTRAQSMTKQLLAIGKGLPSEPTVIDLRQAVDRVAGILRTIAGSSIELHIIVASPLPPIIADPLQIEQILVNLTTNAREAMPHGGRLEIQVERVDIARARTGPLPLSLPAGCYAGLRVSDTGRGMDEETRAHAFEPFFTTRGVDGTGLGLATVYGIVRQNRGYISLASQPSVGTTCAMWFPRTPPPHPSAIAKAVPPARS